MGLGRFEFLPRDIHQLNTMTNSTYPGFQMSQLYAETQAGEGAVPEGDISDLALGVSVTKLGSEAGAGEVCMFVRMCNCEPKLI